LKANDFMAYMDVLYKSALVKIQDEDIAADLVKDDLHALEIGKALAKDTFGKVNPLILKTVEKYNDIPGFSVFNPTQKYLCAVLSMRLSVNWRIYEATTGKKSLCFEDYPDRPNHGKWVLMGTRYPHGYNHRDAKQKYNLSGRGGVDNVNEHIFSSCEWNSALGPTSWATFKYNLSHKERAVLIDAVRTNSINAFQAELLLDMERYGFIKTENGVKVPAVPYISRGDEKIFFDIEREAGAAFCNACLDETVQACKDNIIAYPKRIPFADEAAFGLPVDFLPMAYVYEAAARGIITIKEGAFYPVSYMVVKENI
jgi:hypothetical protein